MQHNFFETTAPRPPDYGKGGNDENLTPAEGVRPIIQFIPKGKIIWCPFDLETSEYVKQISQVNEVIFGHISTGQDFYKYQPPKWDICISNPPFTNKALTFERLLKFGKPFCLLMTFAWFRDASLHNLVLKYNWQMQVMWFNERMVFYDPVTMKRKSKNKISFTSVYLCKDFLPCGNVTIDLEKYKDKYIKQGKF